MPALASNHRSSVGIAEIKVPSCSSHSSSDAPDVDGSSSNASQTLPSSRNFGHWDTLMSKAPNDEPSARKWRSAARIDVLPLLLAPTRIVVLGSIWTLPSRRNWQSSTNRRDICPDNDVVASAADIVAPLNPYRDAPTCSSLAPRRKLDSF